QREVSLARTGLGFAPSLVLLFTDDAGREVTGLSAKQQGAQLEDMYARLSDQLTDDLVAVVREGLANAARHAQASSVHIRLVVSPATVTIEVEDDGVGISEHRARNSGLANLGSRAQRHDGDFSLTRVSTSGGSLLRWSARLESLPFMQVL
ncbi:MAG TPA: ATP-binding protein, partial [Beutenbergiaceae bacterium]|nr:ATP-binding protein [Beutenbergiaceae bacterium]